MMAKSRRGSSRRASRSSDGPTPTGSDESGGFVGQLGIAETGGTSPGLVGIALALGLAVLVYPIGWLWRKARRRA
jgi:hypothetical protein